MIPETTAKIELVKAFYRMHGLSVRVTSTDRSWAEQDALYRRGKTPRRGGESLHNFGRAADLVPGASWPKGVARHVSFQHIQAVCRAAGLEAIMEPDHVHAEDPPSDDVPVERG